MKNKIKDFKEEKKKKFKMSKGYWESELKRVEKRIKELKKIMKYIEKRRLEEKE